MSTQPELSQEIYLVIVRDLRQRVAAAEAVLAQAGPQARGEAERQLRFARWALEEAMGRVLHKACVEA